MSYVGCFFINGWDWAEEYSGMGSRGSGEGSERREGRVHTNIISVELVDTDKGGDSGCPKRPPHQRADYWEFAVMEVVDDD